MKVIYVAGPFRAPNAWEIEQNIRRAETVSLEIWRMGAAALTPHCNTRFFQGAAADSGWMDGDLEMLRRCDAVFMVDGWQQSIGATTEYGIAQHMDMPVFTSLDDLRSWLKEEESPRAL